MDKIQFEKMRGLTTSFFCGLSVRNSNQIFLTLNMVLNQIYKNPSYASYKGFIVASEGIEPSSQVPETYVLSIVLRSHYFHKTTKTYLSALPKPQNLLDMGLLF